MHATEHNFAGKETLQLDTDTLTLKVMLEITHKLQLLVERKARDDGLQNRADRDVVFANERRVVHVNEHAHQEPEI